MENLAVVVDVVVVVIVIISAYLAMVRGLVRELLALAGWIAAFFAALFLTPMAQPIVSGFAAAAPILADCGAAILVTFILAFGVALIVIGLVVWLFSGAPRSGNASIIDQGLGFIYGALRGLVLVAVLFLLYDLLFRETGELAFIEEARTIGVVGEVADYIQLAFRDAPALVDSQLAEMRDACEAQSGIVDGAEDSGVLEAEGGTR